QKMVRFARRLRERPLLRAAVRAGEVPVRAAEAVMPVAWGEDEAAWVERARHETVRALLAAVKGGGCQGGDLDDDEERWSPTRAELTPEQRALLDKAVGLARTALCASAPKYEVIVGMCEEYLGSHDAPTGVAETPP